MRVRVSPKNIDPRCEEMCSQKSSLSISRRSLALVLALGGLEDEPDAEPSDSSDHEDPADDHAENVIACTCTVGFEVGMSVAVRRDLDVARKAA